jgi:bifunctional non-homologous end joining protein LigD
VIVLREGYRVRLFTRNDWSDRYPWIFESALKIRTKQFVLDGEAVDIGVDGISDFAALQSRKYDYDGSPAPSTCRPATEMTCARLSLDTQG